MNNQTLTYIALAIVAYLLFFRKAKAASSEQRPAPQDNEQHTRTYPLGYLSAQGKDGYGHGTVIGGSDGEGNVRISDSNTVRKINPQTTFK